MLRAIKVHMSWLHRCRKTVHVLDLHFTDVHHHAVVDAVTLTAKKMYAPCRQCTAGWKPGNCQLGWFLFFLGPCLVSEQSQLHPSQWTHSIFLSLSNVTGAGMGANCAPSCRVGCVDGDCDPQTGTCDCQRWWVANKCDSEVTRENRHTVSYYVHFIYPLLLYIKDCTCMCNSSHTCQDWRPSFKKVANCNNYHNNVGLMVV